MTGPGPVVGDVGEIDLLRRLQPHLAGAGGGLAVPAGDDAAVWQPAAGMSVVVTTDSLVEEVHFHRRPNDAVFNRDLGWKLLAISLSDLAAMGASAGPSFLALTFPADWPVADVEALYDGLSECAAAHGATLAGGNLSGGATTVLTSTCLGSVAPGFALLRQGAQPGWNLAVTGRVGGAAAALRVLHDPDPEAAAAFSGDTLAAWTARLRRPEPRLREAAILVAEGIPVCLDVSDGLYLDCARLLGDGLGVVIDSETVPLADGVREAFPADWIEIAGGGEDYELLFAGSAEMVEAACLRVIAGGGEAHVIGRFDGTPGLRLNTASGEEREAPSAGHEHFAPSAPDTGSDIISSRHG